MRPGTSCRSLRRLAGHAVFNDANNGREDCASDTTADGLPDQHPDIDATGTALKQWQQDGQQRAAAGAADHTRNGIAERAEIDILHSSAHSVTADGAGDELDNQIDKRR